MADRRWQMFEVGDRNREDHKFFAAIAKELEAGGYEAMLHDLLHRDISKGPDPRRTIKTAALLEQVIRAAPPEVRYLHQILERLRPSLEMFADLGMERLIPASDLRR